MPFRLRSTESIADGLRRLAREELSSISKHLDGAAPPRDDAIHEIRKSSAHSLRNPRRHNGWTETRSGHGGGDDYPFIATVPELWGSSVQRKASSASQSASLTAVEGVWRTAVRPRNGQKGDP